LENYLAIKPQSFVEKSSLVVEELQFVQWDIFIWATLYVRAQVCKPGYCLYCLQSVQMLQHVLSLARGGVIISSQFFFSCTGYQSASDFISRLPAGFTGH